MRYPWTKLYDGLEFELQQATEEGRILDSKAIELIERALALPEGDSKVEAGIKAYQMVQGLDFKEGFSEAEPDDLEQIKQASKGKDVVSELAAIDNLFDRVYGGWLGRCTGCLLGKPIEGWSIDSIAKLLIATDNYPIKEYLRGDVSAEVAKEIDSVQRGGIEESLPEGKDFFLDTNGMPEDDDTNYTLLGLKILEDYGRDFTPRNVADSWLQHLPYYHLCTAERVAYRNLVMDIQPPESATYCNGYREWIGAQIRADIYGYVNPGKPEVAAEMAWRDASISHVKNGIYGTMWVAAMISKAFVSNDIEEIIQAGLDHIPQASRLSKKIEEMLELWKSGADSNEAMDALLEDWDEDNWHHWTHTIPNAQIVALALLYGSGDFQESLNLAITAGFDTDCNGATVGSVLGVMLGANALPTAFVEPLNDTLESGVHGFGRVKISEMAERTVKLIDDKSQ